MILQYYVTDSVTGKPVNIDIDVAAKEDLNVTKKRLANCLGYRFHP